MEERKSMGSALVDVFDAGVVLVKSEINAVGKKVGDVAKAKGLGVAVILAAVGPLLMGLIFLILAVFYLLSLWMPAWGAALVIALFSFALTAALLMFAVRKLSAHVDTDMPRHPVPIQPAAASVAVPATPATPVGAAIAAGTSAAGTSAAAAEQHPGAAYVKDMRFGTGDLLGDGLGDPNANVERANHTVYESKPSGEAQYYGSGLNKKLDGHHDDPNVQNPVVLKDAPGITVSTKPTFPEDMRKEGY